MSILDSVSVVDGGERAKGYDPVRVRRKKLGAALQEQINLIESEGGGYRRIRVQRKRDLETDQVFDVEQQRRVNPGWWVDDDGLVRFSMRYGSMKLIIKDGKDTLVLPSLDELRKLLPMLRAEVLAGGLDEVLAKAADALEARFKSRRKPAKG